MKTVLVALLGLLLGFFAGEALAAMVGMICFGGAPSGPVLWGLRSLPFVSAILCAVAAAGLSLRRRSG